MRKLLALAALGVSLAAMPAWEARAATVLAAGDVASCAPDRTKDTATGDLVEGLEGTVLALGDLAYDDGTATEFANCYAPVWGSFKSRTRPVPGNHEYQTAGAAGFYGYFSGLAKYYSFTLGGWTLYALNPYVASGPGSAQAAWFEDQLKADPNQCQLMYWHPPTSAAPTTATATRRRTCSPSATSIGSRSPWPGTTTSTSGSRR